ncbi:flagellar hook protein [Vallicoccus soli]|uniref:Flagellar hook protein n=1 Tax=Vallicoccus soli TaxID=2339232 RepID=A0A3A3YS14_9ACTN|nr:flagellar hook protein [Vallicoccus soli]RJK92457.1 flagellar hook protein [Vallicoccus soli]
MAFRVTSKSIAQSTLHGLAANQARLAKVQEQLSSGKTISRPSDSPGGTVSAMQLRSEIGVNEQYVRNADDGLGRLGSIDNQLQGVIASLHTAQDRLLQGMSTGSSSPASREALAREIESLRDGILERSNETYLGRPLFGGTTPGQVAYGKDLAYRGDGGATTRTVGASAEVRVDVTGPEVFGDDATGVFANLTAIAAGLRAGGTGLEGDLALLQQNTARAIGAAGDIGARTNRVEAMKQAANDRVLTLKGGLEAVEDIDLPRTIVDLQLQEAAYQAALGATSKVITPSLVQFLR